MPTKASRLSALALVAALVLPVGAAHSQDAAKPEPKKAPPVLETLRDDHDFTSVWGRMGGAHDPKDVPIPDGYVRPNDVLTKIDDYLLPWALKKHQEFTKLTDSGHLQKTPEDQCEPFSMPGERQETRMGFRFFTTPKLWVITSVDNTYRYVRINGKHPKALRPSWMGDSIAHWDGDSLVIDTVGFNDKGTFEDGVYHTAKLHVTERISKSADGKWLVMLYTYDDPGSLKMPFKFARILPFFPSDTMVQQEDSCCTMVSDGKKGRMRANLKGIFKEPGSS